MSAGKRRHGWHCAQSKHHGSGFAERLHAQTRPHRFEASARNHVRAEAGAARHLCCAAAGLSSIERRRCVIFLDRRARRGADRARGQPLCAQRLRRRVPPKTTRPLGARPSRFGSGPEPSPRPVNALSSRQPPQP